MDINDAARAGVSLADLKAAAEAGAPVPLADEGRAARVGIEKLKALVEEVRLAADLDGQKRAVVDAGLDAEFRHSVGYAHLFKEDELSALLTALSAHRGLGSTITQLRNTIVGAARGIAKAEASTDQQGRPVGSLLAVLGAQHMRCPVGYTVSPDGIWRAGDKICAAPILPLQRASDIDLELDLYELVWLEQNGWKRRWVKGTTIVNSSAVLSLGDATHLITSANALSLIAFFSAWLEENQLEAIPSVSRLGWVGDETFLAGGLNIGKPVVVSCQDPADLERSHRISSAGTLEGWFEAIRPLATDPVPMTLICAAVGSALLRPLHAHGFLLDLWCESRRGKTTILKVAASAWGAPDHERGPIFSWSGTQTGLQANAWFFQNLPLLLDETQVANPNVLAQATYELPNGQGKARGKPDGSTHRAKTWRLVTISTGERSANAQDARQGAVNRCLSINKPPFGARSSSAARMIAKVEAGIGKHYGLLGPRIIQRVLEVGVDNLRHRFTETRANLLDALNGNPKADFLAVILLAAELAAEVGMPVDQPALHSFLLQVVEGSERDLPREAANAALEWASANEVKFQDRVPGTYEPHGGWLGWWEPGFRWVSIAFRPFSLRTQLQRMGFDYHSILAVWKSRGWVDLNDNGQLPRVHGTQVVRLKRHAMEGKP